MFQVKIRPIINPFKTIIVQELDENQVEQDIEVEANKTQEEIQQEQQVFIDAKTQEVQQKVDQYKAAQIYQLQNGGPGPVASEDIMEIVNQHNSEFEVIIEE